MAGATYPGSRTNSLVGRDAELRALIRRVEAAYAGESGFAFVVGESGIGKTRLVDEAAAVFHDKSVRVLRGRAVRAGAAGMRPFAEALLGLARGGWSPPPGLGPYLAVLGQLVPDWRTHGTVAAAIAPFIYGEAILRVLGGPDAEPSLLILEDLHDADPDTIATLEYLLDNAVPHPPAIICTTRDLSCPALELAEYARRRAPGALIALPRLDRAATAALAAEHLGVERGLLGGELTEALFRDSVGNPLVLTEILRDLEADGTLRRREGQWTLDGSRRRRAPRSLAHSVADHLRRAEPGARRVVQAAAVVGGQFPADLVGAVAQIEDADLWGALDSAAREHFLVPGAREGWFAFRHPLLEQAVRDQLAPGAHRAMALAAAAAIGGYGPDEAEWRVRAAVLRESAGDGEGAGALYTAAGRHALRGGSPALAIDLFRRALACLPAGRRDAAWAEPAGALLTALDAAGRSQDALDLAGEIDEASREGLAPQALADLNLRVARVALRVRRVDLVVARLAAAKRAIGGLRADAQRAELDAIEAYVAADAAVPGQSTDVAVLARRAIERARRAAVPEVECDALITLGYLHGNHRPEQALDCYRLAYRVARENDLTTLRSEAAVLLGAHQWMWHVDASGLASSAAEASSMGAVLETRLAQLSLVVDAVFRARFDEAARLWATVWEDISRLKPAKPGSYALAVKAMLHAHRGDEKELAAAVAEFHRWRGANEDEVPLVEGLALGVAAFLRGDPAAGRAHLDTLSSLGGGQATKYYLCGEYGLSLLADAVDGAADRARCDAVSAQTASRLPWNSQFVHLASAALAGQAGDPAAAEIALAQSLEASAPFPLARHLGLHLVAANAARDGWGEPVRWLREAEAFFRDADNPVAARTCRDRLRLLGSPTRQWRHGSPDVPGHLWAIGVTVREYEVLRLVADHLTNREIAAELHLSHRTVDRHVANLLAKTGSANRYALADLAH